MSISKNIIDVFFNEIRFNCRSNNFEKIDVICQQSYRQRRNNENVVYIFLTLLTKMFEQLITKSKSNFTIATCIL